MFTPLNNRVVYGLMDARDGLVKYVGVTENPIYRFKQHMQEAKRKPRTTSGFSNSKKNLWIREMISCGLQPTLVLLDSVVAEDSEKTEQKWISHFNKFGFLLNNQIEKNKSLK